MKALILTREYPPDVYGGAGVHVEYLTRELSRLIPVEVRTFGGQAVDGDALAVRGFRFAQGEAGDTPARLVPALQALRVSTGFAARPIDADIVHCHTWYAHFGGLLARILYGLPLVVTAHSLEPLRPWKVEQLGNAYHLSSWIEDNGITQADAVIAVSQETRNDVLNHFAVDPARVKVIHNGIDLNQYRYTPAVDALVKHGVDPERP